MALPDLRIVVGSDDAGYDLKEVLAKDLAEHARVVSVTDVGVDAHSHADYPHVAIAAATMIADGRADRGLLVCGTGLGVAIAANKVAGVRAVTAHDPYSVQRSVLSNNAQILAMGQRVVGVELARTLLTEWLLHDFDSGSPSSAKVAMISSYESSSGGAA